MNIGLISQNAVPGLTIFRKDLIKYLVKQGHKVFAFAIDYNIESREIVSELGAIPIDYFLNKSGINIFADLKNTWLLSKKVKKNSTRYCTQFFY